MVGYSIGEVATLSGVTVRTLHHYDRIGLLCPAGRSSAAHRRYGEPDLDRLRRILFYRELGFALPDIADVLSGAPSDDHLRRRHRLLRQRQRRTADLLAAVEQEIESRRLGVALTPEQQFAIFGTDRFAALFAEADPGPRGATCTVEDWTEIRAEAGAVIDTFADTLRSGEPATGERAMDAAEAHRRHLERWFHPCPPERHREIAAVYLASADDTAWEDIAPGYAHYVADAIVANSRRQEDPPSPAAPPSSRLGP